MTILTTIRNKPSYQVILVLFLLFFLGSVDLTLAIGQEVANFFYDFITSILGLFVGLAGFLLNSAVGHLVIGFGHQFIDSGVGGAIDALWVKIRDIFNLTFIFGLVYLGFKMILGSDDTSTRQWLVSLIVAALLVNFSLLFTKTVVDLSNIVATEIAQSFYDKNNQVQIAGSFMDLMGVPTLYSTKEVANRNRGELGYIFGSAVILIVMIFVFAGGALMLTIRFVTLSLYMVFSPLMFIGLVFPGLMNYTRQYWHGFLSRAFVAPIYLLLVYFSYYVLVAYRSGDQIGENKRPDFYRALLADGDKMVDSFSSTFLFFIISAIFLLASLVISQKMGAQGATVALNAAQKFRNRLQNGARNLALKTGRAATFPLRAGARASGRWAAHGIGRRLENQINRLEGNRRSLRGDILRSSPLANSAARAIAKNIKDAKFGFSKTQAEVLDAHQKVRDRIETRDNLYNAETTSTGATFSEQVLKRDRINYELQKLSPAELAGLGLGTLMTDDYAANLSDASLKGIAETRLYSDKEIDDLRKRSYEAQLNGALAEINNPESPDKEKRAAREYLKQRMEQASERQLHDMAKDGRLTDPNIAGYLSDTQVQKLRQQGLDVAPINEARNKALFAEPDKIITEEALESAEAVDKLGQAFKKFGDTVRSISSGERLASLGMDKLVTDRVAYNLTDKQLESLQQHLSLDEFNKVKEARNNAYLAVAQNGTLSHTLPAPTAGSAGYESYQTYQKQQRENMISFNAEQLTAKVLKTRAIMPHLSTSALETRLKKPGISNNDLREIREQIGEYLKDESEDLGERKRLFNQLKKWSNSTNTQAAQFGFDPSGFESIFNSPPPPPLVDERGNPLR